MIILEEVARPSSISIDSWFYEQSNNPQALHKAFREERAKRKEAEIKIEQLEAELDRTKESRQLASAKFQADQLDLQTTVQQLAERLQQALQLIAWFQKQYFGRKSEEQSVIENPKPPAEASDTESETQTKRKRGQKPGKGNGHGRTDRSNLEPEEEVLDIPNCACSVCGKPYHELSETDESTLLEVEVKPHRRVYYRKRYVSRCNCKGKKIVTAAPPPKLYKRTNIGNSLWVYLLVWKYLRGVPVNRVLQDLSLRKLPLSAGTVTGGAKIVEQLLTPLYQGAIDRCRGADFWNADECNWRVFEENDGTRNNKQWWFWLFASNDAIVYLLDKSRSKQVPHDFLAASVGVLMTDRLASYKSLSDAIKKAWCWVHQRRDFLKVFQGNPKHKQWAHDWLTEITPLFVLNHKRVKLWSSQQSWQDAQIALEKHIEKLEHLWKQQLLDPTLTKIQKKLLNSLRNHWPGLTLFLADPRIPLDNNRAERLLRNIVINRKNSYGSGKEWSGQLAAKLFTVFQTWLANGLDPQALLLDYFNECAKASTQPKAKPQPPPDVSSFLPWTMSAERKQTFSIPKNIKRPA